MELYRNLSKPLQTPPLELNPIACRAGKAYLIKNKFSLINFKLITFKYTSELIFHESVQFRQPKGGK